MITKNVKLKLQKCILLFLSVIIAATNIYIPKSFAASASAAYVAEALKIHKNPNWSVTEYNTQINYISQLTGMDAQNSKGQWLNPHIFSHYNQTISYGLPHGKFYKTSKGKMFDASGNQGEYQFLGYTYEGYSITNDHYFSTTVVSKFTTYKEVNWQPIEGASNTWGKLASEQINYLLNTCFHDDEFLPSGSITEPPLLKEFLTEYKNKAYVQSMPGLWRGASVKLVYNNTNWNTITWDPIGCDFTGKVKTDKDVYTMKEGENEVNVYAQIETTFEDKASLPHLEKINFDFYGNSDTKSVSGNNLTYTSKEFTKTFKRSDLKVGTNIVKLDGFVKVYSKYQEYEDKKAEPKTITINVEASPDPWVVAAMVADPNNIRFDEDEKIEKDIPVKLNVEYGIGGLSDVSKISHITITIPGEGTFYESPVIIGKRTVDVTIPADYMNGKDKQVKPYEALVSYHLVDGTRLMATAKAAVTLYRSSKPEEPEDDEDENNPPEVELEAPETVRAGDLFKVRAKASDTDKDPLSYYWECINANEVVLASTYREIWYSKDFADSTQPVYVEVSDGKEFADDVRYIYITEPFIIAQMEVSGTLKENRKITLKSTADTPKKYPLTYLRWSIEPVTESGTSYNDIKYSGSLENNDTVDLLFKKAGKYNITLYVANLAGYSDTITKTITIQPDEVPIADLTTVTTVYRDATEDKEAKIYLQDRSYSNDNDVISQRVWKYKYDSNNDGSFDDESWSVLSSTNLEEYTFLTKNVGKYLFQIDVKESFGQETIPEFITDNDYRRNSASVVVEVANIAPVVSLSLKEKEIIDIVLDVGDTTVSDLNIIRSKANQILKPALEEAGFTTNITVKNMDRFNYLHNKFAFVLYTYDTETYSFKFFNPDTLQYETIKSFSKYQYNKVSFPFLGPDGYLYYFFDYDMYKIDPITKQESFVRTSNIFKDSYKAIGMDSKLYFSKGTILYAYDFQTNSLIYRGQYNMEIGPIAVDKNGNVYAFPVNRLYKLDFETETLIPIGSAINCEEGKLGPFMASDSSRILIAGTKWGQYYDPEYFYELDLYNNSDRLSNVIFSGDIYHFKVAPYGRFYFQEEYYQTGKGYDKYHYSLYDGYRYNLGSYEHWDIRQYIGHALDFTEYFWDDTSFDHSIFNSKGNRLYIYNEGVGDSWDKIIGIDAFFTPFKIPSIITSYNETWNSKDNRFYVTIHDDYFGHMFTEDKYIEAARKMIVDSAVYVGIGTNKNKDQIQNVINNLGDGLFINNVDLDSSLYQLRDYLLNRVNAENPIITRYVEVGKEIEYETSYEDYESDPQYSLRYKYTHDPNYFENSLGLEDDIGEYIESPKTVFNKPGLYDVEVQARDNPVGNDNRFDNYRLWSLPKNMNIIVHRPPVAEPHLSYTYDGYYYRLDLTDTSYDLDHTSLPNKGIVQKVWYYKDANNPSSEWIEGKLSNVPVNSKYYIKLAVMDMEYSWDEKIIIFDPEPSAQISIVPAQRQWTRADVTATITYSNPSILQTLKYQVTGSDIPPTNGAWIERRTDAITVTLNQEGIHYIHAHGIDKNGKIAAAIGGPYKIDKTPPIIQVDKPAGTYYGNTDINITASDTLSGFNRIQYALTTTSAVPASGSSAWITSYSAQNTVTTGNNGRYYLHAIAYDVAGNSSTITFGPYDVYPNRPPVLNILGTVPSFIYEGDNVSVRFLATDPDLDNLSYTLTLKKGSSTINTFSGNIAPVSGSYLTMTVPILNNIELDNYSVTITVRDAGALTAQDSISFTVNELSIQGQVYHTEKWDENRLKYNNAARAAGKSEMSADMFFPGERFMLQADTTLIAPGSSVTVDNVTVRISGTSYATTLNKVSANRFTGSLWHEDMMNWRNRTLDFIFTVTYSNGTVKTDVVRVYIVKDDYYRLHMEF